MDDSIEPYEEEEQPRPARKRSNSDGLWNVLSALMLLGVLCLTAVFGLLFFNPNVFFNPFPPLPLPPTVVMPPPTETPFIFPATWTATITLEPSATPEPAPATPTPTLFVLSLPTNAATQTALAIPTPTVESQYSFVLANNPSAVASTIIYPGRGCSWFGVGGQVRDMQDAPFTGAIIHLGGSLAGSSVDMDSMSGTYLDYGQAGYEFTLGETPVASTQQLWIQLRDLAGLALSDRIFFDTFEDCSRNLILMNFKQVR